eukprot:g2620.t1
MIMIMMIMTMIRICDGSENMCCYQGCSVKPLGCNGVEEYCSQSKSNCETDCKGTFCPASDPPSPTPNPTPPPSPSPTPAGGAQWCPSSDDYVITYTGDGNSDKIQLNDRGYTIHGAGGVATKASYDMIGGYIEYDIDFSSVHTGVNANIYSISPSNIDSSVGYTKSDYCDGADNSSPWCVEVDFIESNGDCGGATTLHTVQGPGSNGCTSWGCRYDYHYNGKSSFHMRIEFGEDGTWTTTRDGTIISGGMMSPQPTSSDWDKIKNAYASQGAVIYSSEWTGWVPVSDCGTSGDLESSSFTVSNMKIKGSVVQGPKPAACTLIRHGSLRSTGEGNALSVMYQWEKDVGIVAYCNPDVPGFTGILKQRYTDFMVNEVDPSGRVVRLIDIAVPEMKKKKNASDVSEEAAKAAKIVEETREKKLVDEGIEKLSDVVGEEAAQRVRAFVDALSDKTEGPKHVLLPHVDDKNARRTIHGIVRENFEHLRLCSDTLVEAEDNAKDGDDAAGTTKTTKKFIRVYRGRGGGGKSQSYDPRNSRKQWPAPGLDYLHFTMYKQNVDTIRAIDSICRMLRVGTKVFSYAGTKDKRAVTVQRVSAYHVTKERLAHINNMSNFPIRVGAFEYAANQLRLGDHGGNRFNIILRDVAVNNDAAVDDFATQSAEASSSKRPNDLFEKVRALRDRLRTLQAQRNDSSTTTEDNETKVGSNLDASTDALDAAISAAHRELRQAETDVAAERERARERMEAHALEVAKRRIEATRKSLPDIVRAWKASGFINYFGLQRFGSSSVATSTVGAAVLRKDWTRVIELIVNRKDCDASAFSTSEGAKELLKKIPYRHRLERSVVNAIANGETPSNAFEKIPIHMRRMYAHAFQSLVWNAAVSERARIYGCKTIVPGDLVLLKQDTPVDNGDKRPSMTAHVVTSEEIAAGRFTIEDVVMPLPGREMTYPEHQVGRTFYAQFLESQGISFDAFQKRSKEKSLNIAGAYRTVIVRPKKIEWELLSYSDVQEDLGVTDLDILEKISKVPKADGSRLALRIAFTLGKSTYATMCLRELMKRTSHTATHATATSRAVEAEAEAASSKETTDATSPPPAKKPAHANGN